MPAVTFQTLVFCLLILVSSAANAQEFPNLKAEIKKVLERQHVPGASVAIAINDHVVWAEGIGISDLDSKQEVTRDTLFQAASISKPVASAGALKLVDDGKLDLDKIVSEFLLSWKIKGGSSITLRQLLSHSSGLAVHGFAGYREGEPIPTLAQILSGSPPANSPPIQPASKQGRFQYSGGGYCVVQQIVEDANGMEFSNAMSSMVLLPLDMTNSTFAYPLPNDFMRRTAAGHDASARGIPGKRNVYPEKAAAGLWTTASDLAKFAIAIQQSNAGREKSFLSKNTVTQMLTPQSVGGPGLGLFVEGDDRSGTFEHGGVNNGFTSLLRATKSPGAVLVIMTNSDNGGKVFGEIEQLVRESK